MKKPVSRQPSALHEYNMSVLPVYCHRWQSVAWKTMMCFDVTTLDDVKADPNQTAKRKSR